MIIIKTSDPNFGLLNNTYFNYAVHKDDPTYFCLYNPNESNLNLDSSYIVTQIPSDFYQCCISYLDFAYYPIEDLQKEFQELYPTELQKLIDLINSERDKLCFEPIEYSVNNTTYLFKADQVSQQDITDAALQALVEGDSFSKDWITYDGVVTLKKDDIMGLKYAVGYRRQNLVYQAAQMKSHIKTLTYEDLMLYTIQFS